MGEWLQWGAIVLLALHALFHGHPIYWRWGR